MTITIIWWMIPTLITVVGVVYALFIYDYGGGYFSGMVNMSLLVPVLAISTVAWVIAAFLK